MQLAFAPHEFEARLERIQAAMSRKGLDVLVLTRPANIFYVSGYRAAHIANRTSQLHAVIIPANGQPRMIARVLERETVATQWTSSPQLFKDQENPYQLLSGIIDKMGHQAPAAGVEERFLSAHQLRMLQQHLPQAEFVDASGLIEDLAASPSAAELDCLRRSARVTAIGLETGMREIREGTHPYEIIGRIHEAMYTAGQSDFDRSLVAVWSGPNGGRMHDTSTTNEIRKGDIVTVEIMGVDNHYMTGSQACAFVGSDPPENILEAHSLITEMYANAKSAVHAGATAGDVFEAANSIYRAAKGSDYYRRAGGSMGLTNFTLDLVKNRADVLQSGMPLLIQTLVDDPVLLTCASTVLVTETGCEELTQPMLGFTVDS